MIKKYAKLYLTFLILVIFSSIQLAQTNPGKGTGVRDADFYGVEIVFVVDVSVSMESDIECVKDFIHEVFQVLNDPVPGKNNFHLITYSDYATYHPSIKGYLKFKEKIGEELKKTLEESDMRKNTYPKNGLWEVFDLIERNFIQKVGVVLLISDGEDSRKLDMEKFERDMEMSLKALRNIGFSVFPIFVNTGVERYMREDYMDMLRKLAGTSANLYEIGRNKKGKKNYEFDEIARNLKNDILNHADFNSPRLYSDVKNTEKKWEKKFVDQEEQKNEILVKNEKLKAKNRKLEGDLYKEQSKSGKLEKYNSNLTLENEKYKSNLKWLWIILIVLLSVMVLGIVGFLDYRHEWKWSKSTWKWFKDIFNFKKAPSKKEKYTTEKIPLVERLETQPLDTLWGKLVDWETRKEYDLMDKKNGYPPDCLEGVKFFVDNRDNKKVIWVRQEKGRHSFYDKNGKGCKNNCGYIGTDTRFVIIKNFRNNEQKKFEYHFLDRLENRMQKPVLAKELLREDREEIEKSKKNFIGRMEILENIKNNFKKEKDRRHCLICGMGNSGKTSLMRFIHNVFLPNDRELNGKYISKLIEFNYDDYIDKNKKFSDFESEIRRELGSIDSSDKRKRLILIDEYDKVFQRFGDDFGNFFKKIRKENVESGSQNFFILAGQRGQELLKPSYQGYISEYTTTFVLSGLDDLKSTRRNNDQSNSIKLIDNLLNDIGFPICYLPDDVKNRIIKFSSGFPYFVKKILHQLLINWLGDHTLHPLKEDCVDKAVADIRVEDEIDATKRAFKFDEEFDEDFGKVNSVSIAHIIEIIRKEYLIEGRINKEKFRDTMAQYNTTNKKLIEDRYNSFDRKISHLKNMGLMTEEGSDLIPIPYMFFH